MHSNRTSGGKHMLRPTDFDWLVANMTDGFLWALAYLLVGGIATYFPDGPGKTYGGLSVWVMLLLVKDITGRSPGKVVMGLRIVRKSDGGPPRAWALFVRGMFLLLGPVEVLAVLIDPSSEGLGAKVTGTIVIRDTTTVPDERKGTGGT